MNIDERRKILVDALRSGKYEFGRASLRRGNRNDESCVWCVGGAMCEEYRLLNPETSSWAMQGYYSYAFNTNSDKYRIESNSLVPTNAVLEFYGLSIQTRDRLIAINDYTNEDGEKVVGFEEMATILQGVFDEVGIEKGELYEED